MFKFTILFVVLVAGCLMLLNDVEAGSGRTKVKGRAKSKFPTIPFFPNHGKNPPAPPRNAPNSYFKQKFDQVGTELTNSIVRAIGSRAVDAAFDAIKSQSCSDGSPGCSGQPAAVSQQPLVTPAQTMDPTQ